MKFLLCSANICRDPYPVYPLGMSVIARTLKNAGYEALQWDLLSGNAEKNPEQALADVIGREKPDAIGFTLRNIDTVNSLSEKTDFLSLPLKLCRLCKCISGVPLIIGGPGFTLAPEKCISLSGADYGIPGEGETSILRLAALLNAGTPPPTGILPRRKAELQNGADYPETIADFYYSQTHILPVQTKRGCPFHCAYCSYPALEGRTLRCRPPEEIATEVASIMARYPDVMIYFVDAVFNDPHGLFRKTLLALKERALNVPYTAFLTPSGLTEKDVSLMAETGMIAAELGIDAASDQTLRGIGKNFRFADAAAASALLRAAGIAVTANLIFGGPDETDATIEKGIDNVLSLEKVYSLIFAGVRLLPHTPILKRAQREGIIPAGWDGTGEQYYFSPAINPPRMHERLESALGNSPYCFYPPHKKRAELAAIHRIGYAKLRKMNAGQTPGGCRP